MCAFYLPFFSISVRCCLRVTFFCAIAPHEFLRVLSVCQLIKQAFNRFELCLELASMCPLNTVIVLVITFVVSRPGCSSSLAHRVELTRLTLIAHVLDQREYALPSLPSRPEFQRSSSLSSSSSSPSHARQLPVAASRKESTTTTARRFLIVVVVVVPFDPCASLSQSLSHFFLSLSRNLHVPFLRPADPPNRGCRCRKITIAQSALTHTRAHTRLFCLFLLFFFL